MIKIWKQWLCLFTLYSIGKLLIFVISNFSFLFFSSILQNKWFYFYKSRLQMTSISSIGNLENGTNTETILNHDDFIKIFHAYGYGLLSLHDPEIKQQILNSMQCLNERKKLYHREVFRSELLLHFLSAILKTLLCPEGVIQRDLLITVLFTMGQVDNTSLKQVFQETGYSFVTVHWSSIFEATVSHLLFVYNYFLY